ncbi:unnamed protein product [Polarella glacialis]|uniref:EF-hand domain-containing protein n=1 Tax=Polarella glacialis TaxID=89957 RepID=A0A813FZF7_POLGL|nr:unnamed protein product [Polarella glacialis]
MVPLLQALQTVPPPTCLASLNLELCRKVGSSSCLAVVELLSLQAGCRLRYLNLNGIHLSLSARIPLCKAIKDHAVLASVHLADTGLSGQQCTRLLLGNNTVEVFDLGWNCFDAKSFEAMGELLTGNRSLQSLSISNCSAALSEVSPVASVLELLSRNIGLTMLDVSMNHMDYRAALVVEDALMSHTRLTRLNVSSNHLGVLGMRSMLRLLAHDGAGLTSFDAENTATTSEVQSIHQGLVFGNTNPGGLYVLDLSKMCRTAERLKLSLSEAFTNIDMKPAPYKEPTKNAEGLWTVPSAGLLTVTFSIEKGMGRGLADKWAFGDLLDQYMDVVRVKISLRKVRFLLAQWRSIRSKTLEQMVMLNALSKDFCLDPAHIVQFCRNREISSEVIWRLLHCVGGGQGGRFLVLLNQPNLGSHVKSILKVWSLLTFNPYNPTGHYKFDLSNPTDHAVAQQLLLLDRWEAIIRSELKRADTSQKGNRSCFFNELYQNHKVPGHSLADWKMPESGVLEFDYVSGRRPSDKDACFDEDTWVRMLTSLHSSKASPEARVHSALRPVSHLCNLQCVQVRQMLGLFGSSAVRSEIFLLFYFRMVDIHNEKMCRVGFGDREEYRKLQQRLGQATLFPYIQPEQFTFEYDLSNADARIASLVVFSICAAEKTENLKEPVFINHGDPEDESNFWRSMKEVSTEIMPRQGIFKGSYLCAPEDRDFKTRKKLLETYGFWQLTAAETDVRWWASLTDSPPDVLDFVEWLSPRYLNLEMAYIDIDGSVPGGSADSGSIIRKEFEGGLAVLGCNKLGSSGIDVVFRYLDPSGEGTISPGKWQILELLWREIQLSLEEFVKFLERMVGDTMAEWWKALDTDGSNEISFEEWGVLCKSLGFFGASTQIFKFIDKDGEGNVSFSAFQALESYARKPAGRAC